MTDSDTPEQETEAQTDADREHFERAWELAREMYSCCAGKPNTEVSDGIAVLTAIWLVENTTAAPQAMHVMSAMSVRVITLMTQFEKDGLVSWRGKNESSH